MCLDQPLVAHPSGWIVFYGLSHLQELIPSVYVLYLDPSVSYPMVHFIACRISLVFVLTDLAQNGISGYDLFIT